LGNIDKKITNDVNSRLNVYYTEILSGVLWGNLLLNDQCSQNYYDFENFENVNTSSLFDFEYKFISPYQIKIINDIKLLDFKYEKNDEDGYEVKLNNVSDLEIDFVEVLSVSM
jgi:hypothetical protein